MIYPGLIRSIYISKDGALVIGADERHSMVVVVNKDDGCIRIADSSDLSINDVVIKIGENEISRQLTTEDFEKFLKALVDIVKKVAQ